MILVLFLLFTSSLFIPSEPEFISMSSNQQCGLDEEDLPGYGKTWMYIPDGEGHPTFARLTPQNGSKFFDDNKSLDYNKNVKFFLYTQDDPKTFKKLKLDDVESLIDTDLSNNFKIIIHGWRASYNSTYLQALKDSYLKINDYNVVFVDWSPLSASLWYFLVVDRTYYVGKHTAKFIDFLVENGASLDNMHIIGHSLGAHVAGCTGSNMKLGIPGRITGLDPAGPLFWSSSSEYVLDPTDASFVDVIHTCSLVLSLYGQVGTVDFYPDGGTPPQPGCSGVLVAIESCSHIRACVLFRQSIEFPTLLPAVKCDSWLKFKGGLCNNNDKIYLGEETSTTATGAYYLYTTIEEKYKGRI